MPTASPYATLGVSPTASQKEVRAAYIRLALRHHPDRHPPSHRAEAEERFKAIGEAYAEVSREGGGEDGGWGSSRTSRPVPTTHVPPPPRPRTRERRPWEAPDNLWFESSDTEEDEDRSPRGQKTARPPPPPPFTTASTSSSGFESTRGRRTNDVPESGGGSRDGTPTRQGWWEDLFKGLGAKDTRSTSSPRTSSLRSGSSFHSASFRSASRETQASGSASFSSGTTFSSSHSEHPEASPTTPTAPTTSTAPTIPTSAQPSNSTVPKWISTLFPGVPVAAHRPLRTQRQEAPPLPTPSLQNVTAAFSAIFPDSVASIDPDLFEDVWQEMARLAQEDQHYITELYEGSEWSGGSARRTEKGGKKWWAGVKDWFAAAETDGWERP